MEDLLKTQLTLARKERDELREKVKKMEAELLSVNERLSKELDFTRKPGGGVAEHIGVLEAFADGDPDNTELLMILIELRSLRKVPYMVKDAIKK